ncbi:TetR family transcriptional regulator [Mycobacterium avium]|uniref:TetR family transcriptional regulator n=1 Tax=Mycobacterium avium TaxID=1764 RepID=UPI001594BAA3
MNECSTPGTVCNTSGTQHHRHARAAIVNAAASMMYHRGVAATSIGDVSHASGAEVRELDRHFRDKTELVRAVIGSVPGSGVSDGGVSVPDVRGPSRESLW